MNISCPLQPLIFPLRTFDWENTVRDEPYTELNWNPEKSVLQPVFCCCVWACNAEQPLDQNDSDQMGVDCMDRGCILSCRLWTSDLEAEAVQRFVWAWALTVWSKRRARCWRSTPKNTWISEEKYLLVSSTRVQPWGTKFISDTSEPEMRLPGSATTETKAGGWGVWWRTPPQPGSD